MHYHLLVLNQHAACLNKLSSACSIIFTPCSPKMRRSFYKSCKNCLSLAQATLGMKWSFDHVVQQRYFRRAETVLWIVMFLWGWRCFVWRSSQDAAGSWDPLCLFKDIHWAALPFSSVFRAPCSSCVTFCGWLGDGCSHRCHVSRWGWWTPHGDRRGRGDRRVLRREGGGWINEAWNGYSFGYSAPSRSSPHWGALLPYFFPKCFTISRRHCLPISDAPFCDVCVRRTCVASLSGEFCAWEWVG